MKKLKNILFKIIIIYMISYIFLANSISSYARVYDENCGKYVSDYARDFIEKYGGNSKYGDLKWEGGSFGQGTFWCVCTTGVAYMYEQALGIKISGKEIGFNIKAKANLSKYSSGFGGYGMEDSDKWDKIDPTESSMKPGDILIVSNGSYDSHAELYIGNGESANFGSGGANNCVVHKYNYTNWSAAFRLKGVDVTPNGNVPNASTSNTRERGSIYGSSGFIYQGTPESSGYSKSKTLGEFIVDSLKEILDWLIGIITYLFRAVIVGYASLFEHLIIDGLFDSLTGDGKVDETQINSDNSQTAQEQNVETETTTEPTTEEVTEKLENTASAAVKEKDAAEPKITVENIVFNRVPFLDANFFNFEKAGGEEIQPGSVIYLIRSNIAMWYYVFRVFGIALMLVILIYLGIKLAISSVAQDKAIYKKMLEAWVVGFLLLFLMHFIMILILQLNQSVIELITPKDENGVEYSLYLTVKTMAYEIKASTGWAGTIMYIVLIYYAIRFLYYYLRRLLHIFILVILSPIVAITSAIEKINKNGSSKGGIYGSWLKDYVLTVTQQAVHAIIYVIFIMTILKLVETSLLGIILSFVFLNFMLKAEKIFSKIFGYGEGTEFGKGILPNAVGIFAASKVAKRYKNYMQGVSKPIVKPAKKLGVTTFNAGIRMIDPVYQNTMGQEFKSIGKGLGKSKEKAYKKYEKARNKAIVSTIKNTGKALKTSALGVLVIPSFILDPQLGFVVAGKTAGNVISMNKSKRTITGATKESTRREFKLKGEYKSPQTQAKVLRQAINYLEKNGIDYRIKNNNIYVFDINNGEWKELHAYKKITRKRNGLAVDIINLLPGINIKEEAGLKNPNFVIATEEKIALLDEEGNVIEVNKNIKAGNIAKGVAKFYANANGLGLVGDVMTIAELTQLDLDDHTDKLEIYNKAIKTEDKIVREYEKSLDKLIVKPVNKSTEALANNVSKERSKQFNENVKELTTPIEMNIIKTAVENYKTKSKTDTQNRINRGIVENVDYMRIAEEINKVLETTGDSRRIDVTVFSENIKEAVKQTKIKDEGDILKMDPRLRRKNEDPHSPMTGNAPQSGAPQQGTPQAGAPQEGAPQSGDPQQGIPESNNNSNIPPVEMDLDKIIKQMQAVTKKPEVKIMPDKTEDEYRVATLFSQMQDINKEAEKELKRKLWNIDNVLEQLRQKYNIEHGETE